MAVAEELQVLVRAEVNQALQNMQRFGRQMDQSSNKAQSFSSKMVAAGAAIGAAIIALRTVSRVVGDLVDSFAEQEQAEARLNAIIEATGGAAGFTADELERQAAALQQVTTYGDESIISMQAIIATFRSIQGDVFTRTTELALDMSAAFGQDLKSSAIQLGKALEDPTIGLTALRRIGVSFTEQQQDMIKAMVEAGQVAEAQTLILDTLESQVGGVARAMGETGTGAVEQLKNAFSDFKEGLGFVIIDAIEPLIRGLTSLIEKINEVFATLRQNRENESILGRALIGEGTVEELERAMELQQQNIQLAQDRLHRELDSRRRIAEYFGEQSTYYQDANQRFQDSLRMLQIEETIMADIVGYYNEAAAAQEELNDELAQTPGQIKAEVVAGSTPQFFGETQQRKIDTLQAQLSDIDTAVKEAYEAALAEQAELAAAQMELAKEAAEQESELINQLRDEAVQAEKDRLAQLSVKEAEEAAKAEELRLGLVQAWVDAVAEMEDETERAATNMEALEYAKQQNLLRIYQQAAQAQINAIRGVLDVADQFARMDWSTISEEASKTAAVLRIAIDTVETMLSGDVVGIIMRVLDTIITAIYAMKDAAEELENETEDLFKEFGGQIKDTIADILDAEYEMRQRALEKLNRLFDQEYDVLYDQWQRNLITTEQFTDAIDDLNESYEDQQTVIDNRNRDQPGGDNTKGVHITIEGDVLDAVSLVEKLQDAFTIAADRGVTTYRIQ